MPAPDSGLTAQTRAAVAELARAVAALRPLAEAGCPLRTVGGWAEPGGVEPGSAELGAVDPAEVTGWVDAHFTETGVKLELHAIDPKHAKHGDKAELTWRKG